MGIKLRVWRQGQFYPELGKKVIELPYDVRPGPSDDQISIEGFDVQADKDGNFLEGNYNVEEEDAINTYGTARQVIDMYEGLLGEKIRWSWQKEGIDEPLRIRIRNNDVNARFLKKQHCIELDYYGYRDQIIHNCRTVDIIAHEMGHAILDSILPHLNTGSAEQLGLGEAFCDLTAMFLILHQEDLCVHLLHETNGDLKQDNILSLFAAGHGFDRCTNKEIRSALSDLQLSPNRWISYDIAQVTTGVLYDLFYDIYQLNSVEKDSRDCLYQSGKIWKKGIIDSFLDHDLEYSSLAEFKASLLKNFSEYEDILKMHLRKRCSKGAFIDPI